MDMKRIKFEVFGIVQGVYFRACTKDYALSIGVSGWVQNTKRSTVIGEAEGQAQSIQQFKHWLSNIGSPSSTITDASFIETDISHPIYENFIIK